MKIKETKLSIEPIEATGIVRNVVDLLTDIDINSLYEAINAKKIHTFVDEGIGYSLEIVAEKNSNCTVIPKCRIAIYKMNIENEEQYELRIESFVYSEASETITKSQFLAIASIISEINDIISEINFNKVYNILHANSLTNPIEEEYWDEL